MSAPLVTGETTIAELRQMLDARGVKRLELHSHKWRGNYSPTSFSGMVLAGEVAVSVASHDTLAEALSALLSEIPTVGGDHGQ